MLVNNFIKIFLTYPDMKCIITYVEFRELLEKYRLRSRFNKSALASKIGITPSYYMQLESGARRAPPIGRCDQIAKLLNLSESEKQDFIKTAVKERAKEETLEWLEKRSKQTYEIPVISWAQANDYSVAENPLPPGAADDYVITTTRGENMFALKVNSDCMIPEFVDGDLIVIKPGVRVVSGDYIVARISTSNEVVLRQYKRSGKKIVLHPLNKKYEDAVFDTAYTFEIIGKVVEKVKKY